MNADKGMAKIFLKSFVILTILRLVFDTAAVRAVDRITAMVNVTNAAGTTNGQTIQVNASLRTWTNNVVLSQSQILTNSTAAGSKTNLYAQLALNPVVQVSQVDAGSTNFQLIGSSGAALTVTLSAGWGTVSYSTQTVSTAVAVRIPTSIEAATQQTNINSGLVAAIDASSVTNAIHESSPVAVNLVGITNDQTVAGIKRLTNAANLYQGTVSNSPAIGGNVQRLTNGWYRAPVLDSPTLTNGVNYGNAFSSPGTFSGDEQFGVNGLANGGNSTALGNSASAINAGATALGYLTHANGYHSSAIGNGAIVGSSATNGTALGSGADAEGVNSSAFGTLTLVTHSNSTAVGYAAATTANNQVMLASAGVSTVVNNNLSVGSGLAVGGGATIANGVTNLIHSGTNWFPAGSAISFGRFAISSLANGNNAGVIVGTNVVCDLSGPSGAFTINGMVPVYAGQLVYLVNRTGFNLTIANQSGVDATAANRIICLTGADKTVTGNSSATLWYDGNASRWILLYFGQ